MDCAVYTAATPVHIIAWCCSDNIGCKRTHTPTEGAKVRTVYAHARLLLSATPSRQLRPAAFTISPSALPATSAPHTLAAAIATSLQMTHGICWPVDQHPSGNTQPPAGMGRGPERGSVACLTHFPMPRSLCCGITDHQATASGPDSLGWRWDKRACAEHAKPCYATHFSRCGIMVQGWMRRHLHVGCALVFLFFARSGSSRCDTCAYEKPSTRCSVLDAIWRDGRKTTHRALPGLVGVLRCLQAARSCKRCISSTDAAALYLWNRQWRKTTDCWSSAQTVRGEEGLVGSVLLVAGMAAMDVTVTGANMRCHMAALRAEDIYCRTRCLAFRNKRTRDTLLAGHRLRGHAAAAFYTYDIQRAGARAFKHHNAATRTYAATR